MGDASELDIEDHEQLVSWLHSTGRRRDAAIQHCRTLAGGVSCRTVLVAGADESDMVLKQALEYLRVSEVWKGDPARVAREAEAMRVLNDLLDPGQVPQLLFEDPSAQLIAMTAVPEPHENWKSMLLRGDLDAVHVEDFGRLLAAMHRTSWERRAELAERFADQSQFLSLRIDPYYRFAAQEIPEAASFLASLIEDTAAATVALVHGDFSPKNILIHDGRVVLLDHEVAHWGDPAFDVGFATVHFLGKANHLAAHRPAFAEAAELFWTTWSNGVGDLPWYAAASDRAVRHSIGCTLARVRGKSPLEYLTEAERDRQLAATIRLVHDHPPDQSALIAGFVRSLTP